MFTIEQIKTAHAKVRSGADFPQYIRDIKQLGVKSYETFVMDGHSLYHGQEEYRIQSDGKYPALAVATTVDGDSFVTGLKEHQAGKTDYLSFCRMAAEQGVEKWIVDIGKMTCTYVDKTGKELLVEQIPA
jgi:uncharacterized protein YbcV (DUF1398 family)